MLLGTIEGEEYFLDDFRDIENKDSLVKMQGKLVIEFAEISTMRRAEVNELKGFLSRQEDVFRPPYGRNAITSKRQCVFIGTVNPDYPYLRDITGNRRYWPVSCKNRLPLKKLEEIVPQLHAEAAHYVKNGEKLHLTEHEYDLATEVQKERVAEDLWIEPIEDLVTNLDKVTTKDILLNLGITTDKVNQLTFQRIGQIMTYLGFERVRLYDGGKRPRGFKRIDTEPEQEEIEWD